MPSMDGHPGAATTLAAQLGEACGGLGGAMGSFSLLKFHKSGTGPRHSPAHAAAASSSATAKH